MGRIDETDERISPLDVALIRRGVSKQVELMLEEVPSKLTHEDYMRLLPTPDQVVAALQPYEGDLSIQLVVVNPAVGLSQLDFSPIEGRTYPIDPNLDSITDNPRPDVPYIAIVSVGNPNVVPENAATALETVQYFIQNRVTIDSLSAAGSLWPALKDSGYSGFTPLVQNSRPPHMCPIHVDDRDTPSLSVRGVVTRNPVTPGRRVGR